MTMGVTIEGDFEGRPLDVLGDLVAKREKLLKNETTKNAVTATVINVLGSLRADTKKAPLKAKSGMYTVTEIGSAGWRKQEKGFRRLPVSGGHWFRDMYPINLMYGLKGDGKLYRITVTNPNIRPTTKSGAKNAPYYIVMAPTRAVAEDAAKRLISRALGKESGMAKYALGIAQAKVSDRPMNADAPSGSNQMRLAYDSAVVLAQGGDGSFAIDLSDNLNYAALATKSGPAALDMAMKKAANKTAGILNSLAGYKLNEPIPTPFPEVTK